MYFFIANVEHQEHQGLLVDDSTVLRERVLEMLQEITGVELLDCAADGLRAISCIRRLRPDAVALDIQMPGGTGLDVLKNIRPVDGLPLFIVFTNLPYPQYRKRALECGAQFFFDKASEFDKLRELIWPTHWQPRTFRKTLRCARCSNRNPTQ